jgi:cytochrome c-type biogenesis protein CcmH
MNRLSSLAAVLAVTCLAITAPVSVHAVQPDEILKDPALERQARDISANLRCLVCQNQSIDDSDAPLARDLRLLVRERLQAGDSPNQVVEFVVDRYGEFILLRPRLSAKTYLLWIAPLLLFACGIWMAYRLFRPGKTAFPAQPPALSESEQKRLREVLERQPN